MRGKMWVVIIAGLVLLLLAAGFVFFQSARTGSAPALTQNPPTGNPSPQSGQAQREITVIGKDFSYDPPQITIKEGEAVRLTFKNMGRLPHSFVIDEIGVQTKTIQPGETDTVDFVATKTGTFTFYCSVANHKALGMEGNLEIK